MIEAKQKALSFNVRLKSNDSSGPPRVANYAKISAQSTASVDFAVVEPALVGAIGTMAANEQAASEGIEGQLVTRVAMGMDVLVRLHQQVQHALMSLGASGGRQADKKES